MAERQLAELTAAEERTLPPLRPRLELREVAGLSTVAHPETGA
jgi:hypothetical protein